MQPLHIKSIQHSTGDMGSLTPAVSHDKIFFYVMRLSRAKSYNKNYGGQHLKRHQPLQYHGLLTGSGIGLPLQLFPCMSFQLLINR